MRMTGDRLYTDIRMALERRHALRRRPEGETTAETLADEPASNKPTYRPRKDRPANLATAVGGVRLD